MPGTTHSMVVSPSAAAPGRTSVRVPPASHVRRTCSAQPSGSRAWRANREPAFTASPTRWPLRSSRAKSAGSVRPGRAGRQTPRLPCPARSCTGTGTSPACSGRARDPAGDVPVPVHERAGHGRRGVCLPARPGRTDPADFARHDRSGHRVGEAVNAGSLFARHALLPNGWAEQVRLTWDAGGTLTEVRAGTAADGETTAEWVVPGMVNLHSHAFQRAMAGLAETAGDSEDSFCTWRELMYGFAGRITPEQLEAVAAQLFVDCLRHGYTSVCEFHYLHRDPDGCQYAAPAEMAARVASAAQVTGMGLTMLPVLYSHGGFGGQALGERQRRFNSGVDDVLAIVSALAPLRSGQFETGA